jgi:competence protein ComEC
MKKTLRLPLIPILFVYLLGLLIGCLNLSLSRGALLVLLAVLLILWSLLLFIKKPLGGSCLTLIFFLFLGIFSIHLYLRPPSSRSPLSRWIGPDPIAVEGIVHRPPERSQEGTQLLIQSDRVFSQGTSFPAQGRLLLFLTERDVPLRLGDRLRFLCRVHSPRGFHNPGVFSYERHLAFKRIDATGFLSGDRSWVKIGEGFSHPLLLQIENWRDHIRRFLGRETDPRSSGILKALVLGEQGDIPEEVKEHFIVTGIAHLLAISGDHLGIVALLSYSLLLWLLKRSEFLLLSLPVKKWAAGLTLPCILLYMFIAGGGISVIRATIMVVTFFLSILFDRERNLLHTLGLAAFLILLFSPPSLFNVSFQLSFVAVLSILYFVPRLLPEGRRDVLDLSPKASWKRNLLKYLKISFLVTGVAFFGTAPFVAFHFNRISLMGWVTNLFAIPWVGFLLVPLSLIASLLSFFFSPLATLLIRVTDVLTLLLLKVVALFASVPLASFSITTPTIFEMTLFYLLLFLGVHLRKGQWIRYAFVGLCVVFVIDLAFWNWRGLSQKNLEVTFIDVGHGDAILVEFPKGKKMLIDGGGLPGERFDIGKQVVAPFLWKKKIRKIDTLVLTHPDPDHVKGLNFIASRFSIGRFWETGSFAEVDAYLQLKKTLSERNVGTNLLHEEMSPQVISGVQISILNPSPGFLIRRSSGEGHRNPSQLNNNSLVMTLQYKNIRVLLAADVEKQAEERMIRKGHDLRADVLKIPHHGSASSSTSPFLRRVNPTYAILSASGRNIGRLPHPEVMKRYEQLGASIFRTDRHGAITMITDGKSIAIKTFLKGNR